MAIFEGADGTRLAYHQAGEGRPLIGVPGGPMQASAYLGDLGGLSAHHSLVLLDLRGTGASAIPADPASYRCDRQVDDVEALRIHLGLKRIDLLAHSAGAALALLYAARPRRPGSSAGRRRSPLASPCRRCWSPTGGCARPAGAWSWPRPCSEPSWPRWPAA
jgi:pimeloyl-ACP methyl ester carboxylesterase